jgi:hypothetical protein
MRKASTRPNRCISSSSVTWSHSVIHRRDEGICAKHGHRHRRAHPGRHWDGSEKLYLEHRPVRLSKSTARIPQPG